MLVPLEQFYMDELNPEYNCCKVAGSILGMKMSKETNYKNSLRNRGCKNANAKLRDRDIPIIIEMRKTKSIKDIANKFSVSDCSISRVLNGKSFKHLNIELDYIPKKIFSKKGRKRLSELAKNRRNRALSVIIYNESGEKLGAFPSMNNASKELGINVSVLSESYRGIVKKPKYIVHDNL